MLTALALALTLANGSAKVQSDLDAAGAWIGLVDAKHWDESWKAAGSLFKSQMPQARWQTTIQPVREPLGAVLSRSLSNIRKSPSLPGAPDGEYEVIQYHTAFAHKASSTETIVLSHESEGWKVDGYFIR